MISSIEEAGTVLQSICHQRAYDAGWWQIGQMNVRDLVREKDHTSVESAAIAKAFVAQKLALCHSELSEGLEGDRKGLMDDKLPHRKMIEVELADAVIRAADLAGALGLDLGGAIAEKLAFNANRPDHKPENRAAAGGKAY